MKACKLITGYFFCMIKIGIDLNLLQIPMPASCGFAKYLIVAVSDDLCYVFGKADGAFLGKVKNEETLGNDMHIEGMIKIDNNAFVIQYRTDMNEKKRISTPWQRLW